MRHVPQKQSAFATTVSGLTKMLKSESEVVIDSFKKKDSCISG